MAKAEIQLNLYTLIPFQMALRSAGALEKAQKINSY